MVFYDVDHYRKKGAQVWCIVGWQVVERNRVAPNMAGNLHDFGPYASELYKSKYALRILFEKLFPVQILDNHDAFAAFTIVPTLGIFIPPFS